jgi:hypothetical protein
VVPQSLVFLSRPKIAAAFSVAAVASDLHAGIIEGVDLERVAKFLLESDGLPQFDLEFDGRVFSQCRLAGDATSESISFRYDSTSSLGATAGDEPAPLTQYHDQRNA